jgi:transcriptional regulator GlxA family with amidase domain
MNDETLAPGHPIKIVIVGPAQAEILDVAGPFEVFVTAANFYRAVHPEEQRLYDVELVSATSDRVIRTSCGLELTAAASYRDFDGPVDTLLVAGGTSAGISATAKNGDLLHWLQTMSKSVRRLGSICTGAFVLAAAGLLRGRRATTHWSKCEELAQKYSGIHVEPNSIYTVDGSVYTSAGVTAGMDLSLALVESDVGAGIAADVAREMVLYLRRPGGQPQLSTALALQAGDRRRIRDLRSWILEHTADDLSVAVLADRAAMSPRHFARTFSHETGSTPGRFVARVRVEIACRRLEESDDTMDQIATQCGFDSANSMRRAFLRLLHVTPSAFRTRLKDRVRV